MHKPRVMQRLLSHRYDTGIVLNQEQVISLIPLMYVHMLEVIRAMFLPCTRAQATGSGSLAMCYALAHVQVSSSLLSLIIIDASVWVHCRQTIYAHSNSKLGYNHSKGNHRCSFLEKLNRSFLPFI